jgi:hypothetical protein
MPQSRVGFSELGLPGGWSVLKPLGRPGLTLLNDPQFVEAARVLAERLIREHGADLDVRINAAFRLLASRIATTAEQEVLRRLYARQRSHFAAHADQAAEYISTGEAPRDQQLDPADHAATTALVQTLMNFDECVSKRYRLPFCEGC